MGSETVFFTVQTESELQDAIDNGLTETHRLDFKRELGTTPDAKKNLAIDIASLSVDGGTLIIGVDEGDKKSPPTRSAQDLTGLAERVAQIAKMRPEPGITVRTSAVLSASGNNFGYLIVHIPASSQAPHQVDGQYYGRSDTTNYRLSDPEVERLISQRLAQQKDMVGATRDALEKLLFDAPKPPPPLMVLLAEPMGGRLDDPLVRLAELGDTDRWETVRELLKKATVPEHHQNVLTLSSNIAKVVRRAGAVAATTNMLDGGLWKNDRISEIRLYESGAILLASQGCVLRGNPEDSPWIVESLIVSHTDLVVHLAPLLSERYGFAGAWRFGLIVTDTRDGISSALAQGSRLGWERRGPQFNDGEYPRATSASLVELEESPEKVVSRLISSLLRSLDSHQLPQWSWLPS
jgi:Putative DNA-binding domain